MKTKTKHEQHFVVIYDTETRKWYVTSASDYLPEGCIWDKDQGDWIDWEDNSGEEEYNRNHRFLEDTLRDFNIFSDTYRSLDEESEI